MTYIVDGVWYTGFGGRLGRLVRYQDCVYNECVIVFFDTGRDEHFELKDFNKLYNPNRRW